MTHRMNPNNIEVYDAELKSVHYIPKHLIAHLPQQPQGLRQLFCKHFLNTGACPLTTRCKFAHVHRHIVDNCSGDSVHVNYAYKTADSVKYERHDLGQEVEVWAPNRRDPKFLLGSEYLLRTRGSELILNDLAEGKYDAEVHPACHCAHYYFGRVCNRGSRCYFIHAVCIDAKAKDGALASTRLLCKRGFVPSELSFGCVSPLSSNPGSPSSASTRTPPAQIDTTPEEEPMFAPPAAELFSGLTTPSGRAYTNSSLSTTPRAHIAGGLLTPELVSPSSTMSISSHQSRWYFDPYNVQTPRVFLPESMI